MSRPFAAAAAIAALGLGVQARAQSGDLAPSAYEPAAVDMALGARPFVLAASEPDRARALRCLTQAIYYEAATEPREGQEAVAQVVLNRLKHPAFPKSVCGVVFEGSERSTGCQFTFTCDGSLARAPVAWRWDAAEQVAAAALAGHVATGVGAATHYHAAYVTPYWSAGMVRIERVGAHIFYRLPGEAGSPESLTGQYGGAEPAAPVGLMATAAHVGKGRGRHAAARPSNGVAEFSVWGLQVATITAHKGEVTVKSGS